MLTSFWDFHATLEDILHFSKTGNWHKLEEDSLGKTKNYSKRGISLLRPVPVIFLIFKECQSQDRSCAQAEIPEAYCVCRKELSVDTNSVEVAVFSQKLFFRFAKPLNIFCHKLTYNLVHFQNAQSFHFHE